MKKLYTLFALLLFASFSKATIHPITASGTTFTPPTVNNAVCGDTILWAITNFSESHTTTSTSVPAGAAGWGANLNSSSPTYSIVLTVAGTYSYQCTPHSSMGMKGTITVSCPSGVSHIENGYLSTAFPSPFSNKLTIEFAGADMIAFYNVLGEKVKTISVANGQTRTELSGADIQNGVYFYAVMKEGVVIETRKIMKN